MSKVMYNIYRVDLVLCHDGEWRKAGLLPDLSIEFNFREAALYILISQDMHGTSLQARQV